jgi:diaminopimelate epimerase
MRFAKMQGVGNDFVVVSSQDTNGTDLPALALKLCDRHFGIGSDGLLIIGPPAQSTDAAYSFRMFNPDGSEDMCGNGLRCAALWAYRQGLITTGDFNVSTKDGIRACHLVSVADKSAVVTVNMGEAKFAPADIPLISNLDTYIDKPIGVLDKTYQTTAVNTGSTHAVVFIDSPIQDKEFLTYSPYFENHPLFPERTSVLWSQQTGKNRFTIRIWERGADETLGCGTGACAVAVAAVVNGKADRSENIVVTSKGGSLTIRWTDTIWMTGPAELVYEGTITSASRI